MHAHDLRDWSRWAVVVVTLIMLAGVVRWYARHGQETAMRAAATSPVDARAVQRTAATVVPDVLQPSAAMPANAGTQAVSSQQELPRGVDEPAPPAHAEAPTSEPGGALPSQPDPVAVPPVTPKPVRRAKPRPVPPPEAPAPVEPPPVSEKNRKTTTPCT